MPTFQVILTPAFDHKSMCHGSLSERNVAHGYHRYVSLCSERRPETKVHPGVGARLLLPPRRTLSEVSIRQNLRLLVGRGSEAASAITMNLITVILSFVCFQLIQAIDVGDIPTCAVSKGTSQRVQRPDHTISKTACRTLPRPKHPARLLILPASVTIQTMSPVCHVACSPTAMPRSKPVS